MCRQGHPVMMQADAKSAVQEFRPCSGRRAFHVLAHSLEATSYKNESEVQGPTPGSWQCQTQLCVEAIESSPVEKDLGVMFHEKLTPLFSGHSNHCAKLFGFHSSLIYYHRGVTTISNWPRPPLELAGVGCAGHGRSF